MGGVRRKEGQITCQGNGRAAVERNSHLSLTYLLFLEVNLRNWSSFQFNYLHKIKMIQ